MATTEYENPLSQVVMRLLHDKLYEKRKTAALEIEKLVRVMVANDQRKDIQISLDILTNEFALSSNSNSKKGGLIGLAACAIALGSMDVKPYLDSLIKPVLICSADQDSRIRYFACEALYNIVKVARTNSMLYFNQLFNSLTKLTADSDDNVRKGSELLDRLLKDIVLESRGFDVSTLIPVICEMIYTNNAYTRTFLVQWIVCFDNIPHIQIIVFLPRLLDGLFLILGDKHFEIQKMCEGALDGLLSDIQANPSQADIDKMTNIVIIHCQSRSDFIKSKALLWLNEFTTLDGATATTYASGIIKAILPTLAYEDLSHNNVREYARMTNQTLMKLIDESCDENKTPTRSLPINEIVQVLTDHLQNHSTLTKIAVLRWYTHLHNKIPYLMLRQIDVIFPHVMQTLSDPSDEVVLLALECLAEIVSSPAVSATGVSSTACLTQNQHFENFLASLIQIFHESPTLLENRSTFIIRQLSVLLNAEDLFSGLAELLLVEDDYEFVSQMVQILNSIMMSSSEFFELRNHLKNNSESSDLFECLYKTWSYNPIATLSLCLLTQNYKHCYDMLMKFSQLDVTVGFLTEADKLIQLLESPIFTSLRLQLLDCRKNVFLLKSLFAILMLLPQTTSFHILQRRLNCVPYTHQTESSASCAGNRHETIDFKQLLQHFETSQEKISNFKRLKRKSANIVKDT